MSEEGGGLFRHESRALRYGACCLLGGLFMVSPAAWADDTPQVASPSATGGQVSYLVKPGMKELRITGLKLDQGTFMSIRIDGRREVSAQVGVGGTLVVPLNGVAGGEHSFTLTRSSPPKEGHPAKGPAKPAPTFPPVSMTVQGGGLYSFIADTKTTGEGGPARRPPAVASGEKKCPPPGWNGMVVEKAVADGPQLWATPADTPFCRHHFHQWARKLANKIAQCEAAGCTPGLVVPITDRCECKAADFRGTPKEGMSDSGWGLHCECDIQYQLPCE